MNWEIVPDARRRRRSPSWTVYATGVLLVLLGLSFLIWPFFAVTWAFAVLVGAGLIGSGLAVLARQRPGGVSAFGGVIVISIGVLTIVFSDFAVGVMITFIGMTLISIGVLWLVLALALSRGGMNVGPLPAVLLLAAGVVAIVWPSVALLIAAVVFGLLMLGAGIMMLWGSARRRGAMRGAGPR